MKLIDLHVHSTISDGTISPTELVYYAKQKGLSAIALTDHDTIDGIDACMHTGKELGITVIPGIEFSAYYAGTEIHILGYNFNPSHPALKEKLTWLVNTRINRNKQMLEKLHNLGLPLTEEDLKEVSEEGTIFTRAHFGAALFKKGYVASRNEAFDKYIGRNKPAYVQRPKFSPEECIHTIHAAGGIAVLAHPKLYGLTDMQISSMIYTLCELGLDGIEVLYSTHTIEDTLDLLSICMTHRLLPTGGSDFHGENKPDIDLGCGYGNLKIPFDIYETMLKLQHLG